MAAAAHRYCVLQAGARMHYAVPALLARAGALAAFYTDLHASHRPFALIQQLWPRGLQPAALQRLLARQLPAELPRSLVRDQPLAGLGWAITGPRREALLLERACRERFAGASALYTNFINSDLQAVRQARHQGLHVVHELIITADVGRILLEERRRFPGIEAEGEPEEVVEAGLERDRQKWALVDRVLVPPRHCRQSTIALGCDPAKICRVPYGIPDHWFALQPQPEPGRLLFVGQVGLRKGSHVLAEAVRLLQARGVPLHCRVVGPQLVDVSHPLFHGPTYLGPLSRDQVQEEFRRADLFVLPTLAEGSALVHLEAMACALPVITTPPCGAVLRHGREGSIVPSRDPLALADQIQLLLENRPLRSRYAAAARRRAWRFTWARYSERLLRSLQPQA